MPKIVVPVLTEKEVNIINDTLAKAAPHMTPAGKRDTQKLLGKIKNAQRTIV